MKTFMTTAAVLAVLTAPVFAQGLTAGSESKGEPQASGAKESAKDPNEKDKGAMGQGQAVPRATTGAASDPKKDPAKESAGSGKPPEKTGVTTGGGTGGSSGGGGGGGEGGSDK